MKFRCKLINEIQIRLKAPVVALERIARGQNLPKAFVKEALNELGRFRELLDKMEERIRSGTNS